MFAPSPSTLPTFGLPAAPQAAKVCGPHTVREIVWLATGEDLGAYWDNWYWCV